MNIFATLPIIIENDRTVAEDIIFFLHNLDLFPYNDRIEVIEEIGESIGVEKQLFESINDYIPRIVEKLVQHLKSNKNCAIIFKGFFRRGLRNVNDTKQRVAG